MEAAELSFDTLSRLYFADNECVLFAENVNAILLLLSEYLYTIIMLYINASRDMNRINSFCAGAVWENKEVGGASPQ